MSVTMLSSDQVKLVDETYKLIAINSAMAACTTLKGEAMLEISQLIAERRLMAEGLEKMAATFNAARDQIYLTLKDEDKYLPGDNRFPSMEIHASVRFEDGTPLELVLSGVWGGFHAAFVPVGDGTYRRRKCDVPDVILDVEGVFSAMGDELARVHPETLKAWRELSDARRLHPVTRPSPKVPL